MDVYKGKDYSHGFLSVPVPSCLRGYETLHKAYGRMPWAQVLAPAIELAENGFVLTKPLGDFIQVIGFSGAVNGIMIDPSTGFRLGGADPRENGYALGW